MLKLVVCGAGKIPRGFGLAPRKDPFDADLKLIELILNTGGLEPYFINPDTGKKTPLTMENYERMYKAYGEGKKVVVAKPAQPAPETKTVQSAPVVTKPAEEPKVEEPKKEEEKKDDSMSITPVANPNNNGNNNGKHNNNNNRK